MKHTPGPWEVGDLDKNGQRIVRGEHIEICTCWHHSVGSIEKEMEANARLIASAPEMSAQLAAAKEETAALREQLASARAEITSAHDVLDDEECKIIRNAKDGYPEGREPKILSLAERVKALLLMKMDYKRWLEAAEASQTLGVKIIAAERLRQIEKEGWTHDHDDQWTDGQLICAARCYAEFAEVPSIREMIRRSWRGYVHIRGTHWPFDGSWWKPSGGDDINGRILELAKAGALIAAEIDRLKRSENKPPQEAKP